MHLLRTIPFLALLTLAACDESKSNAPASASTASTASAASAAPKGTASTAATASASAGKETAAPLAIGEAATYDLDATHSTLGFSVKHMMISNVHGVFEKGSGQLHLEEDLSKITLKIEIDPSTINTRNADRDKHLKSPDFFDTAKFPKMTFVSKKVERSAAGFKVTGDLTIKDVTKPVVLDVDALTPETKGMMPGTVHRGAHAVTKINRQDFGLKWSKTIESGGAVVSDEVQIELDCEFFRKKA